MQDAKSIFLEYKWGEIHQGENSAILLVILAFGLELYY
jgi:hypothetical protein